MNKKRKKMPDDVKEKLASRGLKGAAHPKPAEEDDEKPVRHVKHGTVVGGLGKPAMGYRAKTKLDLR